MVPPVLDRGLGGLEREKPVEKVVRIPLSLLHVL